MHNVSVLLCKLGKTNIKASEKLVQAIYKLGW